MDQQRTASRPGQEMAAGRSRAAAPLVGGATFLLGFVGIILAGRLSDVPLPLPGSAQGEVYAYFSGQTAAVVTNGVLQGLSAAGLGIFLVAVTRRLTQVGLNAGVRLRRILEVAAVLSLTLSALTSIALAVLAPAARPGTVATLQQVGFVLGGVVHVVTLGALVWYLGRTGGWSPLIRRFGLVAAVPAVLSVLSVVVFPASVLLPLGRVLCMVWTIAAGVSLLRGHSLPAPGLGRR